MSATNSAQPALRAGGGDCALPIGLVVVWRFGWPVMKAAPADVGPFTFVAIRIVAAGLLLGVCLAFAGQLRIPSRHDAHVVALVGSIQMAGFMTVVNVAILLVGAGR